MRAVLQRLRLTLPDLIPPRDKELVRMLRAARHAQRYPVSGTKRGRPGRWARAELLGVAASLSEILGRETLSHCSLASFVDHYLRVLDFPADVARALVHGQINLFEAEQLARVTAARLAVAPTEALRLRAALLSSHLQTKASGERLRRRVNELLGAKSADRVSSSEFENSEFEKSAQESEDLEDFDPYDPTHLFWEQLKQLGFAFREIRREDVTDEEIDELLKVSEPVMTIVARIQRRKERAQATKFKL